MFHLFRDRFKRSRPVIKDSPGESVVHIPVDQISPNPYQPRKEFDEKELSGLAKSISHLGIVQPIIVRKRIRGYELVAGERRLRASRIAGLKRIPAIVRNLSDPDMLEVAFVENLQRQELNVAEIAESFKRLSMEFESTSLENLSKRLGADIQQMIGALWIIKLHPLVRKALVRKLIDEPRARILNEIKDEEALYEALNKTYRENLSINETYRLADRIKSETDAGRGASKRPAAVKPSSDSEQVALCLDLLRELLISFYQAGVPVEVHDIKSDNGAGLNIIFSKGPEA